VDHLPPECPELERRADVAACIANGGTEYFVTAHPCSDDHPINNQYASMVPG
jgi:hypothetical protein